jgi:hypothetical protein
MVKKLLSLTNEIGLKQGKALPLWLFNFALLYAIRKIKETGGTVLSVTHKLLAHANGVNLLYKNINTIKM